MSAAFTPALLVRFDALRSQYPPEMKTSLVLPLLHCVQDEQGFVTEADAVRIAEYIGMPAIQVVEALTWYTMFDREPQGRYVIKVCRNIACSLRGSENVLAHLQQKLGIGVGETTADGRFTAMMPHPERVFRNIQMSWTSGDLNAHSPWMRIWRNARRFVG